MNGYLRGCNSGNAFCVGLALAQFTAPANTVLVSEDAFNGRGRSNQAFNLNDPMNEQTCGDSDCASQVFFSCNDGNDGHPAIGTKAGYNCSGSNPAFHDIDNGSLNYLAFDGHVKYLKANAVDGVIGGTSPSQTASSLTGPFVMTYNY